MSDILADYREWRTQQAIRVSTHSDGCHMWHRDCMIHRLAAEVERLRLVICNKISELGQEMERPRISLTDAEREAIEWAARMASRERDTAADAASRGYAPEGGGDPAEWAKAHGGRAATLRGLLERTK